MILRPIRIVLIIILLPLILLYAGIILPEYVACAKCNTEGAMGTDIWGNEVQCFGDSKAFGEIIFNGCKTILCVLLALLIFITLHLSKLKRKNRQVAGK